jgi:F-type H+-transporting ATPase subunit gamma
MESLKAIKTRIKTIESIVKAMNAMKMVSVAKLSRVKNANKYSKKNCETMLEMILTAIGEALFENAISKDSWVNRTSGKSLLIVLSTDQGFCGSFNQSIKEVTKNTIAKHTPAYVEIFGKKSVQDITESSVILEKHNSIHMLDIIEFSKNISEIVLEYLVNHDVFEIFIISGEMKNALSQNAQCIRILPLEKSNVINAPYVRVEEPRQEFIDRIFPMYISSLFKYIVTDHLIAEYSARVMAMDNSVRNAKDIRNDLSVLYNNIRQSRITQELTEIVGSVECMQ